MSLLKLLSLLQELVTFIKRLQITFKRKKLKDAKDEALSKGDVRKFEEALGRSAPASDVEHDGMYERDRKKE